MTAITDQIWGKGYYCEKLPEGNYKIIGEGARAQTVYDHLDLHRPTGNYYRHVEHLFVTNLGYLVEVVPFHIFFGGIADSLEFGRHLIQGVDPALDEKGSINCFRTENAAFPILKKFALFFVGVYGLKSLQKDWLSNVIAGGTVTFLAACYFKPQSTRLATEYFDDWLGGYRPGLFKKGPVGNYDDKIINRESRFEKVTDLTTLQKLQREESDTETTNLMKMTAATALFVASWWLLKR